MLSKKQVKFEDWLLNKTFSYHIYSGTSEDIIELYKKQRAVVESRLWKGGGFAWLQSKCELYGIFLSKPELFSVTSPSGLNSPYSFYAIDLK